MSTSGDQADTPPDIRIRCCRECQVEDIGGYCNDCREFFCRECVEVHVEHEIEFLRAFYKNRKKAILDKAAMWEVAIQLEKRRSEIVETIKVLKKEYEDIKREVKTVENRDAIYDKEIKRINRAIIYLGEAEKKAFSPTIKNIYKELVEKLNVEGKIREEFETMENGLEEKKEVLDYFRGKDKRYEFDDERWKIFLLLNEKTHLLTPQ